MLAMTLARLAPWRRREHMRMTMFRAKMKRAWLDRCHTEEERRAVIDACTVDELTAAVNMIRRREAEDDRRLAAMLVKGRA
jgi:hypothetical protein